MLHLLGYINVVLLVGVIPKHGLQMLLNDDSQKPFHSSLEVPKNIWSSVFGNYCLYGVAFTCVSSFSQESGLLILSQSLFHVVLAFLMVGRGHLH